MRKRRILITGASGLLGLNTALVASETHEVFGQVHQNLLHRQAFQTVQSNLLAPGEIRRLLDLTQPDWVIHCAALANVDACERDPQQAHQLNSEVPRLLAQNVARGGARLLHISTDAVFDGVHGGYTEEDIPHPLSAYARSKLEGERAVLEENPEAIVARVNLFGWSLSGRRSLAEFFFNKLSVGERCMGFTDVLFCPMLASDLGLLLLRMLDAGLKGLYHAVGSEAISKYDFGCRIAQLFGFDEKLIDPTRVADSGLLAARSPNLTLSTAKLSRELGISIPNVSTGLSGFYTQYQQGYPQKIKSLGEI